MGIATFVRDAGERIVANAKAAFQMHPGRKEEPAAQAPAKKPSSSSNDKTAGEAIAAGASHIVVGRPVIGSPDPRAAAEKIGEEIRAALRSERRGPSPRPAT